MSKTISDNRSSLVSEKKINKRLPNFRSPVVLIRIGSVLDLISTY